MESEFGRVIDALPGLVWTSGPDGHADFLNQRWLEYTGLSIDEALAAGWQVAIHPDDRPEFLAGWLDLVARGQAGELEARLRRHDGAYRWFEFRCHPLTDASGRIVKWCGLNTDIENLKRAEAAARVHERRFRSIIEGLPAVVTLMTPEGEFAHGNQHMVDYLGAPLEELKARPTTQSFHPEDRPEVERRWKHSIETGEPYDYEARLKGGDGVYRWFRTRGFPLRDPDEHIVLWYLLQENVDDRKGADEALKARERNLKLIIDTTPALIWSATPDGDTESVNQHFLDFVGMSWDQLRGPTWAVAIHPDDQDALAVVWNKLLATGQAGETEGRLRRHDGEYRWFLLRASPLHDQNGRIVKWYGVNTDIEDRKRTEHELLRSGAFLAHGEALSETGSFLWRLESGEIRWSDQLYRIFEFEKGTLVTLERIGASVHPEDLWMLDDMAARAKEGRGLRYEHRLMMPDGSIKHLHFVARATFDPEGRLEYIGTVQNMTERRLSEQALSKVRSELAHVARVTSLNALTASIAHEVNQPLAGIVTNASTCLRMLAADPPNVEGARETARRTIRDGNRASEVITRLRALFAKKGASVEPVDLNEAAREVIALSVSELQRNRVVLRVEFADDLPFVMGDRVQLQQVILNLVLNASDAMSGVNDRTRQLVIRTELDESDSVRLMVRDSGLGFGSQGTEKLFDAFYSTKSDGMGIGLSVSRSIVESHRGRLWAAPNEGSGAAFWFSIPRGPEVAASARRKAFIVTDHNGNFVGEIPLPTATDANATRVP